MNSRVFIAFSLLTICSGVCLCDWGQIIGPEPYLADIFYNRNVSLPHNSDNDEGNLEILRQDEGQLSMEELYSLIPHNTLLRIDGNLMAAYSLLRYPHYWKCTKTNLNKVKNLCESTQIAGLKRFCQYGEQKQNDLCLRDPTITIESLLRKTCIVNNPDSETGPKGIERLVREAEIILSEFDHFYESNFDRQYYSLGRNVYDFCKRDADLPRVIMVGNCLSFYATVTNEFDYLGVNADNLIQLIGNIAGRSIWDPLNLCGHVIDICGLAMV